MEVLKISYFLNELAKNVHQANEKWWRDPVTEQPVERNMGEMLMLVVSEVAEAMEGYRKDLMDDHLPERKMLEVELADVIIRVLDIAGANNMDIGGVFEQKMAYNAQRHDHTFKGRRGKHGKKV